MVWLQSLRLTHCWYKLRKGLKTHALRVLAVSASLFFFPKLYTPKASASFPILTRLIFHPAELFYIPLPWFYSADYRARILPRWRFSGRKVSNPPVDFHPGVYNFRDTVAEILSQTSLLNVRIILKGHFCQNVPVFRSVVKAQRFSVRFPNRMRL